MKILGLLAENVKKLRVIEIRPDGRMVQITGKNGQGKTTVLDSIWIALKGKPLLPAKPVRKGADSMKIRLDLGDCIVTRTLSAEDGAILSLKIEMAKGLKRDKTPQDFLDDLVGELTFDPLQFIHMKREDQIAELRKVAKVDIDFEAIAKANKDDYDERTAISRDVKQLEGQLAGMTVISPLPKEKLDENGILAKLNAANADNQKAQDVFKARQEIGAAAAGLVIQEQQKLNEIEVQRSQIKAQKHTLEMVKKEIAAAEEKLESLRAESERIRQDKEAKHAEFDAAPAGELVDVTALTAELQGVQRTNRAIDTRIQYDELRAQLQAKEQTVNALTFRMKAREEDKRAALAKAPIPVEGLVFDERQVLFNGLPLENLGEGEQIRISTKIAMAANPKLRVICIRHGEALDEDGLKILAQMAEENDFQIWMTKVDSSGKVGIVLEDGMITSRNSEA
jgi:ABC-type cobalamin/Fe3+-siderophores transport system ATPase subunit